MSTTRAATIHHEDGRVYATRDDGSRITGEERDNSTGLGRLKRWLEIIGYAEPVECVACPLDCRDCGQPLPEGQKDICTSCLFRRAGSGMR